ncbi:MAG: diguanylate cyclase [Bacillota bacterium]|nr:diguanylate cyclase [Bacillota bacterium]
MVNPWDLVYIGIPFFFAITVISLTGGPHTSLKFMMAVPVFVAAVLRGRVLAVLTGVVAGALIIGWSLSPDNLDVLLPDILLVLLTLSLGWAFGGITDAEVAYAARLEEMADRDDLTGLYNHRGFRVRLHDAFEKAAMGQGPLTLILGDIDYFKLYNDSYGYQKGDEALARIGKIFADTVGDRGVAARYGGEEFGVILSGQTDGDGCRLAEELRRVVESNSFFGGNTQPSGRITMSFGVATYPVHGHDLKELVSHADHALYRAKFASKNRVEVYSSVLDTLYEYLSQDERDALNSIRTLVMVINAKDHYTFGHSERVADYAARLGKEVGVAEPAVRQLAYGAYLHDIGKVEIDRTVLNKQGPLSGEEWAIMRRHPVWGSELVEPIPFLHDLVPVIKYHHENYDGSGYPEGLKGEEIPIEARIVRIVDSFDAMVTERPYGIKRTPEEACREIEKGAGTLYDPELARVFVTMCPGDEDRAAT